MTASRVSRVVRLRTDAILSFVSAVSDRSQKIFSELDHILFEYEENNVRRPPEAATDAFTRFRKCCESYAVCILIVYLLDFSSISDRKFAKEMLHLVKSAHGKRCYYRRTHDPKFLCMPRLHSRHDLFNGFIHRLSSLAMVKEQIKKLSLVPLSVLEMESQELQAILSNVSFESTPSEAEVLLALCGWSAFKEPEIGGLQCSCCSRKLDLSCFTYSVPSHLNKSIELLASSSEQNIFQYWRIALKELALQNSRESAEKSPLGLIERLNEVEACWNDLLNGPES
ncbi:hypothetical protein M514_12394 [Trichuris suis]|uniref:NuBaID C-terminal domain-containing protein n=1 Tax=Trichuris suis TaxID=68888 RepID=A0A085NTP7_9BILA|nr:hypothetical protein M514_12394 [Trichuris suis]